MLRNLKKFDFEPRIPTSKLAVNGFTNKAFSYLKDLIKFIALRISLKELFKDIVQQNKKRNSN